MITAAPLWILLSALTALLDFKVDQFVTDRAAVLSPPQRERIADQVRELRDTTGVQLAVVLIDSTAGQPIEDTAHILSSLWHGGQKGQDNGLLLLMAIKDRRSRLEVGYGLEEKIPDRVARKLLDDIQPALKRGDYTQALVQVVGQIQVRLGKPLKPRPADVPTPLAASTATPEPAADSTVESAPTPPPLPRRFWLFRTEPSQSENSAIKRLAWTFSFQLIGLSLFLIVGLAKPLWRRRSEYSVELLAFVLALGTLLWGLAGNVGPQSFGLGLLAMLAIWSVGNATAFSLCDPLAPSIELFDEYILARLAMAIVPTLIVAPYLPDQMPFWALIVGGGSAFVQLKIGYALEAKMDTDPTVRRPFRSQGYSFAPRPGGSTVSIHSSGHDASYDTNSTSSHSSGRDSFGSSGGGDSSGSNSGGGGDFGGGGASSDW